MTKNKHLERGGRKKWKIFWIGILILAACTLLVSAYRLYIIYAEYKQGTEEYQKIVDETVSRDGRFIPSDQNNEEYGLTLPDEDLSYNPPVIDFDKLQAANEDIVGWLEIEAMDSISYPIVRGSDNSYYLTHTAQKTRNTSGSIFMDYHNSPDFMDCNTIIYGHNMKNGSMFGSLRQMLEDKKYEDSKYLWICTSQASCRYEIFSIQYARSDSETYTLFTDHDKQFENYLIRMAQKSEVDLSSDDLNGADRIVTLSTCTSNDDIRFVVQARWIKSYTVE